MNKVVTVDYELDYDDLAQVTFREDCVRFTTMVDNVAVSVSLPIEVFYQMWNSDEMMNHMEAYHKRRQENATNT